MVLNVYQQPMALCSDHPMTGFYRDGFCRVGDDDVGVHSVCAVMTTAFLQFSKAQGNDLITPQIRFGFQGLNPGDRWCLCQDRWLEALRADVAPPLILDACHQSLLQHIELSRLETQFSSPQHDQSH